MPRAWPRRLCDWAVARAWQARKVEGEGVWGGGTVEGVEVEGEVEAEVAEARQYGRARKVEMIIATAKSATASAAARPLLQ